MHSHQHSQSVSSDYSQYIQHSNQNGWTAQQDALRPCASTSSLFLFAQGSDIVILRHDSLILHRTFDAHNADITLIAADTCSEEGQGQVISLDEDKEAVVWDSMTGEEIARFTAYEEIRVATFMRNGTIALGDAMGNIILFDPQRSEAVSCRTFQIPITTIAPSADSKFFGIGYDNGAMIIASLMPLFVVHHTLAQGGDNLAPVTQIAWHGSSSRQKSDMLATQTDDGDLKVWSISKPIDGGEPARIVRMLKKPDGYAQSRNWMSWSRNGRIIQYSDCETSIWDVRTKRVVWEPVPTSDNIAAIAAYGPNGVLFTILKDHTVQQHALYPPNLVKSVSQKPPGSSDQMIDEQESDQNSKFVPLTNGQQTLPANYQLSTGHGFSNGHSSQKSVDLARTRTPLGQIAHKLEQLENQGRDHVGTVSMDRTQSTNSNTTSHSRNASIATTSSVQSYDSVGRTSEVSIASTQSFSKLPMSPESATIPKRFHPLSQEIANSPITPKASDYQFPPPIVHKEDFAQPHTGQLSPPVDGNSPDFYQHQSYFVPQPAQLELFPALRVKLSSVPQQLSSNGERPKYDDELRKEMFLVVFGWTGGPESLVREEISTLPPKSLQSLVLRLWINDLDQNSLSVLMGSDMLVSSDWMFVALSAMTGAKGWQQAMRVFIMTLIKKNDLHTAVMCLLALGEKENAVDLYVSNKKYMEATILQALLFKDWRRLSLIVRKWGDHAAENGEGGLAMRCFACTETPVNTPPLPQTSGHQSRPSFGHSRERSLSGSIRAMSPKISKPPSVKSRAASPAIKESVMQSLGGAARLFGFGSDKNKSNEVPEADIMEMPWNRPPEANLPTSPTVQSFFEAPDPSQKSSELPVQREMVISGPMNTISIEARMGTPGLSRVSSPTSSLKQGVVPAATTAPNRTTSPRPPGIARTITPRPGPISIPSRDDMPSINRTTSPAPVEPVQSDEQVAHTIVSIPLSSSPIQIQPKRVASPPPKSESPPPVQRSPAKGRKPVGLQLQLASFQDVLASEPSPELTRVMMPPMHNRQMSGSKLADTPITNGAPPIDVGEPYQTSSESEHFDRRDKSNHTNRNEDYHVSNDNEDQRYDSNTYEAEGIEVSHSSKAKKSTDTEMNRNAFRSPNGNQPKRTFSPVHRQGSSNGQRARRKTPAPEETTSEEEEAQRYEQQRRGRDRTDNHTLKIGRSPSMASGQVRKMGKIIDESEPEDFGRDEYSDEEEEYAEAMNREIRARQRSLERMEREMGTLRRERAKEIPRYGSRNANKRSPLLAQRSTFTRDREYSSVTDEESSDLDTYPGQAHDRSEDQFEPPRRTASRNAPRMPSRTASRNAHKFREEDVPKRMNSRMSNKTPRPRDDDITDDEPTPRPPPSPPRRTASRATPRPKNNHEDEDKGYPPRRTASRTNNRTPQIRQMDTESDVEEYYAPKRTLSRNNNQHQHETDSDEMRSRRETAANPMPRSSSRNTARNKDGQNKLDADLESKNNSALSYREKLANGPSPAPSGLPSNPSTWKLDRTASPMMRSASRSGTPASVFNDQRRKISISEADEPLALPTLPFANGSGRATPPAKVASPTLSDVPDYDQHDYDLPALAAAAAVHRQDASPVPVTMAAPVVKQKPDQKSKMAPSSILNVNHKSSLPQELRTRLNALPPMPDSPMGVPSDLPIHPAFAGNMRATSGLRRKNTPNPHQAPEQDLGNNRSRRPSDAASSGGKQALRMHGGPGPGEQITIGLEGVVINDGGAPVETAPPPRHGRMTPIGQKI